ncbi:MAG: magnesium transporter [Chloroflexia bacterium]
MFYLSEVIGKPVLDHRGNQVARVQDLVAEVARSAGFVSEDEAEEPVVFAEGVGEAEEREVPVVKGVLARAGRRNPPFYISIDQFETLGPQGAQLRSARVDLQPFERRSGEMLLTRDVWDRQVIDLENRKVVRVNDIVIIQGTAPDEKGKTGTRWWVRGVDVGLAGLTRRLRVARVFGALSRNTVQPRIVPWQHLDVFGSNVPGGVALPHSKLAKLHPVEIARITDSVSYLQGAEIIASLNDTLAADTLEELVADRQTDILESIPDERAADILDEMAPDEATDLLAELPEEKASALLEQMEEDEAQDVRQLLRYPVHSAGGIMTTEYVMVTPEMTVREVIEDNRPVFLSADLIYYMYVVDSMEACVLVGIITVRDLLVHQQDETVGNFMLKEFLSVRPGEKEQEVARKMAEYNLLALPVVDKGGVLLGVVTVDDALDALLPEGWKKRLPKIFS